MTAASLERIVRGAIAANVAPPPRQLETQEKAVDEAILEFGGPGQSVYTVTLSQYVELETLAVTKEVQRTVDVVRTTNPDDDTQHVDHESVKSVILQGRDGKKTQAVYAPFREDKDNKITKKNVTHVNPDKSLPVG